MSKEVKLSVNNLKVSFRTDAGKVQAVRDISFDLYKGENIEEGENLRDFLMGNQKYLRGRMMRYVKQKLDYFY